MCGLASPTLSLPQEKERKKERKTLAPNHTQQDVKVSIYSTLKKSQGKRSGFFVSGATASLNLFAPVAVVGPPDAPQ
jgi:hypothetical protein